MQAMTELENLLAQKKAIEQQIKELKNNVIFAGRTRFEKRHYSGAKPDTYYVSVKVDAKHHYRGKEFNVERWNPVFTETDKEKAVATLEEVISDLTQLLGKVKGDGNGTDS